MSNGTNWTRLVETMFLKTDGALSVLDLMKGTGASNKQVGDALIRIRAKYGRRLLRTTKKVGGDVHAAYRLRKGESIAMEPETVIAFGVDLWRGWFNPISGIRGDRLGIG